MVLAEPRHALPTEMPPGQRYSCPGEVTPGSAQTRRRVATRSSEDTVITKKGAAVAEARITPKGCSTFWRQCQKQTKGKQIQAFSPSDRIS